VRGSDQEIKVVKFLIKNEEKINELTCAQAHEMLFDETFIKVDIDMFEKLADKHQIKFKLDLITDLNLHKQSIHRTDRIQTTALLICILFQELEEYFKLKTGTRVVFGREHKTREILLRIASGQKTFDKINRANTEIEEKTEKLKKPLHNEATFNFPPHPHKTSEPTGDKPQQ
jgi:hypothetical protein